MLHFEIATNSGVFYAIRDEFAWNTTIRFSVQYKDSLSDSEIVKSALPFVADANRVSIQLEDNSIVWNNGKVTSFDFLTGNVYQTKWTKEQLVAIFKLAIGGDEIDDSAECYAIAEPIMIGFPAECRPIP